MQHRHITEAVERTFQDIRNDTRPFGGVVMVFAGMFLLHCFHSSFFLTHILSQETFGNAYLLFQKRPVPRL